MEQKPQYVDGSYMGHDIEVRIDNVQPYFELSEIPGELYEQILKELLDVTGGDIDRSVMVEEGIHIRIKGHWRTTIFPENLQGRLDEINKAAIEYITGAIKPLSAFDWPEENLRVEWNTDSCGVRDGEISFVVHREPGDVLVGVYDLTDLCNKAVKLSDMTSDSLITIAEGIYNEKKDEDEK